MKTLLNTGNCLKWWKEENTNMKSLNELCTVTVITDRRRWRENERQ